MAWGMFAMDSAETVSTYCIVYTVQCTGSGICFAVCKQLFTIVHQYSVLARNKLLYVQYLAPSFKNAAERNIKRKIGLQIPTVGPGEKKDAIKSRLCLGRFSKAAVLYSFLHMHILNTLSF